MEYTIENFKKGEFVINCKTQQEADLLMKICDRNGIMWDRIKRATDNSAWGQYEEMTCYRCDSVLCFSRQEFYRAENRTIVDFWTFIGKPKSNKEKVLDIIGIKVGEKFNISGCSCNPYVFNHNYDLVNREGDKRNLKISEILWGNLKIVKIPQDPNAEVKKHIELISGEYFGRNNMQEAILFLLNENLSQNKQKSA